MNKKTWAACGILFTLAAFLCVAQYFQKKGVLKEGSTSMAKDSGNTKYDSAGNQRNNCN